VSADMRPKVACVTCLRVQESPTVSKMSVVTLDANQALAMGFRVG
jgi:hypothetical protein